MKKFIFTNEKYQAIKEKEYDQLKRDMENVDKEIEHTSAEIAELEARFNSERTTFQQACKQGVGAGELSFYQGYFELIKERQAQQQQIMDELFKRKESLTHSLVRVNNELRVLGDMRQEQYQAYCKELAAEEGKELDTHMAFTMFERAV